MSQYPSTVLSLAGGGVGGVRRGTGVALVTRGGRQLLLHLLYTAATDSEPTPGAWPPQHYTRHEGHTRKGCVSSARSERTLRQGGERSRCRRRRPAAPRPHYHGRPHAQISRPGWQEQQVGQALQHQVPSPTTPGVTSDPVPHGVQQVVVVGGGRAGVPRGGQRRLRAAACAGINTCVITAPP